MAWQAYLNAAHANLRPQIELNFLVREMQRAGHSPDKLMKARARQQLPKRLPERVVWPPVAETTAAAAESTAAAAAL
jgi:hypothetical protein